MNAATFTSEAVLNTFEATGVFDKHSWDTLSESRKWNLRDLYNGFQCHQVRTFIAQGVYMKAALGSEWAKFLLLCVSNMLTNENHLPRTSTSIVTIVALQRFHIAVGDLIDKKIDESTLSQLAEKLGTMVCKELDYKCFGEDHRHRDICNFLMEFRFRFDMIQLDFIMRAMETYQSQVVADGGNDASTVYDLLGVYLEKSFRS